MFLMFTYFNGVIPNLLLDAILQGFEAIDITI